MRHKSILENSRLWYDTVWFNFLAHSPSTIIWKPSEITSKEDLGNGLLFPSFVPTENCNLLFDFFYKTGLQRNSKGKKKPGWEQGSQTPSKSFSSKLRESHSWLLPHLPPDGHGFRLLLPSPPSSGLDNSSRCNNTNTWTGQPVERACFLVEGFKWYPRSQCLMDIAAQGHRTTRNLLTQQAGTAFWPRYLVNAATLSHLGLDSEHRKSTWGAGPGCSRVPNKNTVFSCSPVSHYPPPSKMSPVVPTLSPQKHPWQKEQTEQQLGRSPQPFTFRLPPGDTKQGSDHWKPPPSDKWRWVSHSTPALTFREATRNPFVLARRAEDNVCLHIFHNSAG